MKTATNSNGCVCVWSFPESWSLPSFTSPLQWWCWWALPNLEDNLGGEGTEGVRFCCSAGNILPGTEEERVGCLSTRGANHSLYDCISNSYMYKIWTVLLLTMIYLCPFATTHRHNSLGFEVNWAFGLYELLSSPLDYITFFLLEVPPMQI